MSYKIIFLDIDDTLVSNSKIISEGNLAAVKRAQEAGIFVTVATGRGYFGASSIWKQLNIQGPVIVYGGAMIMDTRTDKMLFSADIDSELITEALEFSRERDIHAQIYQGDGVVAEEENEFTRLYTGALNLPFTADPDIRKKAWAKVPKILVYTPLEREKENVRAFSERFKGRLEVASSKPGFIELNQYGSNKGTTMLRLAKELGIDQSETIGVGDNTLDWQMIEMAGLGVCVANGQDCIKEIADVIAPSCEEDGVRWVIDKYIFGE